MKNNESKIAANHFYLLSKHLPGIIGEWSGLLLVGATLASIIHPEILNKYNAAPGIWIYGKKGVGKSTIATWLMKIFCEWRDRTFILSSGVTGAFIRQHFQQIRNLPVWFDEYRASGVNQGVLDVFKDAFHHSFQIKGGMLSPETAHVSSAAFMPIVVGESRCIDDSLLCRFLNVRLDLNRRRSDSNLSYRILESHSKEFCYIGKFFQENQAEFARRTLVYLDKFINESSGKARRRSLVIGVCVSAWMAAADMLKRVCPTKELYANLNHEKRQIWQFATQMCLKLFSPEVRLCDQLSKEIYNLEEGAAACRKNAKMASSPSLRRKWQSNARVYELARDRLEAIVSEFELTTASHILPYVI